MFKLLYLFYNFAGNQNSYKYEEIYSISLYFFYRIIVM